MGKGIKKIETKIKEVKKIKSETFLMSFVSRHIAKTAQPGNFLHLKINSVILRRPFSIHRVAQNKVYILFKVKGRGTNILAKSRKGDVLDIIGPLGEGFQISPQKNETTAKFKPQNPKSVHNILVAGGIGVAPLVYLGEKLKQMQTARTRMENLVLLGAKNKKEILCENDFEKLQFKVKIATDDGSRGLKGSVVTLLEKKLKTYNLQLKANIYACGPKEMFSEISKILKKYPKVNCQVSFEQFMGCGLGICCGCVIKTKKGYKKVCKDGPVFNIKEIW
ncbi:MAG: dihydroorotate dehydrogenase electron transfer subunit [Omnitrophica bacterium]|nr:dihydroorotate dehydrogenase electron transfer subunit [Candidatus Omnitrophota bacterium]